MRGSSRVTFRFDDKPFLSFRSQQLSVCRPLVSASSWSLLKAVLPSDLTPPSAPLPSSALMPCETSFSGESLIEQQLPIRESSREAVATAAAALAA